MIKLIACDLDGTILNDKKEIDTNLKEVVNKLKELDISFTIVSGRNEEISCDIVDYFKLEIPYITNNGGNIYHNHKCLINDCFPSEYNNIIFHKLYENKIPFRAFSTTKYYSYGKTPFFKERQGLLDPYMNIYHPDLDLNHLEIYKITADFEKQMDYVELFEKELKENCPNITFIKADKTAYCFNSLTATKGNALSKLCNYLNIDLKNVMVFGDNDNDISMFKLAGKAVAMGNSDNNMKEIADYICLDNNHNGVSNFLIDYFKLEDKKC